MSVLDSMPIITCSGKRRAKVAGEIVVKGMSEALRNFDRASDDLYSRVVSKVRQPIDSLFNRLIEKADIQKTGKLRSTMGLTLHAYGRLATAFITLIF